MIEEKVVTKKKLEELKKQLQEYKTKERPQVAKKIKEAKEYGDLSENSEYEEAKNQQAFIEGKIAELKDIVKNAKILDNSGKKNGIVEVGSEVILKDKLGKEYTYTLVGALESDPSSGKISIESPLGQALLGKKEKQKLIVNLPSGKIEFEILHIK